MSQIMNFLHSVDNVFHISHKKWSSGMRSGLFGGQIFGPLLPFHCLGNIAFSMWQTRRQKWGRALSCCKSTATIFSLSVLSFCRKSKHFCCIQINVSSNGVFCKNRKRKGFAKLTITLTVIGMLNDCHWDMLHMHKWKLRLNEILFFSYLMCI
jgi:hypothetical protein